jgi:hypothetical protein
MGDSSALLRLLEPAVRPVPQKGGQRAGGEPSFESADFETLLAAARKPSEETAQSGDGESAALGVAQANTESTDQSASQPRSTQPLGALEGIDKIENPTLRRLMATEQHSDESTATSDTDESTHAGA